MEIIIRGFARFIFWAAYPFLRLIYPMKIVWEDKKTTRETLLNGNCVVFSNHLGYVEGLFMTRLLKRYKVWTFVGRDWYEKKGINWLFRNTPYISIERKGGMDTSWLDNAKGVMAKGASVYVLPEGHTSPIDQMDEFKPGFLMLAKQNDSALVPMYISRKIEPFKFTTLVIGKPLIYDLHEEGRPSLVLKKYCNECRTAVDNLGILLKENKLK